MMQTEQLSRPFDLELFQCCRMIDLLAGSPTFKRNFHLLPVYQLLLSPFQVDRNVDPFYIPLPENQKGSLLNAYLLGSHPRTTPPPYPLTITLGTI